MVHAPEMFNKKVIWTGINVCDSHAELPQSRQCWASLSCEEPSRTENMTLQARKSEHENLLWKIVSKARLQFDFDDI